MPVLSHWLLLASGTRASLKLKCGKFLRTHNYPAWRGAGTLTPMGLPKANKLMPPLFIPWMDSSKMFFIKLLKMFQQDQASVVDSSDQVNNILALVFLLPFHSPSPSFLLPEINLHINYLHVSPFSGSTFKVKICYEEV